MVSVGKLSAMLVVIIGFYRVFNRFYWLKLSFSRITVSFNLHWGILWPKMTTPVIRGGKEDNVGDRKCYTL